MRIIPISIMFCFFSTVGYSQNWKNETQFQINYIHTWQIGENSDKTLKETNVGVQFSLKKINVINLNNGAKLMQLDIEKIEDKIFEGVRYRIFNIIDIKEKEIVVLGDGVVTFYKGERGLIFANMEPKFIKSLPIK